MSALLENKIWKVQLPKDKQYAMEMEFRSAGWRTTFLYDEKQTKTFYSYSLHGDTIKVFESGKNYIIQELTDSTLTFLYLPESLTIGVTPVRCTTDNSIQGQRENEERLDSIWRKEDIWNKGTAPINKTQAIKEYPRWAVWDYDLEKYFVSQMKYPKELLKKNVAGHSVVMFSIDTLGLPREINILTTIHKEFDKEIIRLTKELPHSLPCRDKNGKRIECFHTVYVPFLPQHYRDRVKADSIAKEELKQSFVEWETVSYFEKANPYAVTNYINERLTYDPPINKTQAIKEYPRWAVWDYDLEKYFVSQMKYPKELLKKNVAGHSVVMFSIDTLGLPREINILTTIHKEFDKEIIRLTKELPHSLPCRDKNGKRIECFHTVYVPFLPQHYRDRVKADSIAKEELKQSFVEWETVSYFEKANPYAVTNYINERLTYDPKLLNGKKEAKGIYTIRIDSYGEIIKVETLRSCGIPEWDKQVLQIIKGMPRWTPTINYYGKGEYHNSVWTVPVLFKNDNR